MTIEEAKEYLDCIYYSVEIDNGIKVIHISGDWYLAPEEYLEKGTPYRNTEYTGLYIPVEKIIDESNAGNLLDYIFYMMSEVKQYEGEFNEESFIKSAKWMSTLNYLDLSSITQDTPCETYLSRY